MSVLKPSELTFINLLDKMNDYDTIGSLQDMIRILDKLPNEEKLIHCVIIDKIKNAIKGYGNTDNKITNNQRKNLIHIINQFNFTKSLKSKDESLKFRDWKPQVSLPFTEWKTEADTEADKKIDPDDVIYSVILSLLTNLSYDNLSSGITVIITDYLDMVNDIINYDPNHEKIVKEIEIILKDNGWTNSGFYSEPDKNKLMQALQSIANKYLF